MAAKAESSVAVFLRPVLPLPQEARPAYHKRLQAEAHALLARALERAGFAAQGFAAGPHGKPYLPGAAVRFNLTHCDGLAACAVGHAECGIDAECFLRQPGAALRRVCTPQERAFIEAAPNPGYAFFRLWTLKESFVKATGTGLAFPLREAAFVCEGGALRFCRDGFLFWQMATNTHLVSLCVARDGETRPIVPQTAALSDGDTIFNINLDAASLRIEPLKG